MQNKIIFKSKVAARYPNIIHGFGAANDDINNPTLKYQEMLLALSIPEFTCRTVKQVHKATVMIIDGKLESKDVQADAMVTNTPGQLLCINTADCTPILLLDAEANVVGAVHSGWKSAYSGIISNAISAMCSMGAKRENMVACIGPTIRQDNYEVDQKFKDTFLERYPQSVEFFIDGRPGHHFFNLPGYCAAALREAGVETIDDSNIDTYATSALYSYRRDTHKGLKGPVLGQVSAIGIAKV